MPALVILTWQALPDRTQRHFFRHTAFHMCGIENHADALEQARRRFGYFKPYRGQPSTTQALSTLLTGFFPMRGKM